MAFTHKDYADPVFSDKVLKVLMCNSTINPHSPSMQIAFNLICKLREAMLSRRSCCVVEQPWNEYFSVVDVAKKYEAATTELDKAALRVGVAVATADFYSTVMAVDFYAKMLADSKAVGEMRLRITQLVHDSFAVLFRLVGCKVKVSKRKDRKLTVDGRKIDHEKIQYVMSVCPSLAEYCTPLL